MKYRRSLTLLVGYIICLVLSAMFLEYSEDDKLSTFVILFFWAGFPLHLFLISMQAYMDSLSINRYFPN